MEKFGAVLLRNHRKIMWLGVDIYESLLKFDQVKEELNKVSKELKTISKELHVQDLLVKGDSVHKPLMDVDREDTYSNYEDEDDGSS